MRIGRGLRSGMVLEDVERLFLVEGKGGSWSWSWSVLWRRLNICRVYIDQNVVVRVLFDPQASGYHQAHDEVILRKQSLPG
jgi:hypothetical protein